MDRWKVRKTTTACSNISGQEHLGIKVRSEEVCKRMSCRKVSKGFHWGLEFNS
jgi:hypothetical protein